MGAMEAMGTIATLKCGTPTSLRRALVGVPWKMSAITVLSTKTVSALRRGKGLYWIEIASYVEQEGKKVFVFRIGGDAVTSNLSRD